MLFSVLQLFKEVFYHQESEPGEWAVLCYFRLQETFFYKGASQHD